MKKIVIGGAAVLATAGVGLGLSQLANADSASPDPTESSSVSVATGQATAQQSGGAVGGQPGGPDGGMGLRGVETAALAQKLGVEESKLQQAIETVLAEELPPARRQTAARASSLARGTTPISLLLDPRVIRGTWIRTSPRLSPRLWDSMSRR